MGRRQQGPGESPDVRPVDVDGVRTVAIITVLWGVAFVLLALRQGALNDAGRGWWLWTCLAGVGLGLLGLEYCRKRRDAIARAALDAEADAPDEDDWSGVGDWSRLPDEDDAGFGDTGAEAGPPQPVNGEFPGQPADDQHTQPYSPASRPPPGYVTGDMPVVGPNTGEHPVLPATTGEQPVTPPPAVTPPPQQRPAPPAQPSGRPIPPSQPAGLPPAQPRVQPPAAPLPPVSPSVPHAPEPPAEDLPATDSGSWHSAPAGYSPEPEHARRHPRDHEVVNRSRRRTEPPAKQPYEPLADEDVPAMPDYAAPPTASPGPNVPDDSPGRGRYGIEDSEFFADDPTPTASSSDSDFLLFDIEEGAEPEAAQADVSELGDEDHRGRRSRRSR